MNEEHNRLAGQVESLRETVERLQAQIEKMEGTRRRPKPPAANDGYVYFLQAERTGLIKIGTTTDPRKRIPEITTMSPDKLTLLGLVTGGRVKEKALHTQFRHYRKQGEWFEPVPHLLEYITDESVTAISFPQLADLMFRGDTPAPPAPVTTPAPRWSDDEICAIIAGELAAGAEKPSISRLQRRFRLGYTRAKRISDRINGHGR